MGSQIMMFKKNKIDLSNSGVEITVTDPIAYYTGQDFVDFVRNRNNYSAWMTTDSTDAANTQLDIEMGIDDFITDIILVGHNLKGYTIQYWDGASFQDFSPAINVSNNYESTNHHNFSEVQTSAVRIIISGTQVADEDKSIKQIIITERIGTGQFSGWPIIRNPVFGTNRRKSKMLSGKSYVVESVGAFSANLTVENWESDSDLSIIEDIYFRREGFLIWLCGGDEDQFSSLRKGYRKEDIFFVRPTNEYSPEWYKGIYKNGMQISLNLEEAVS